MPECQQCGSHVSAEFARVLGDNTDAISGCLNCTSPSSVAASTTRNSQTSGSSGGSRYTSPDSSATEGPQFDMVDGPRAPPSGSGRTPEREHEREHERTADSSAETTDDGSQTNRRLRY